MVPDGLEVASPQEAADALATPPTLGGGSAPVPPRLAEGIELIGEFEGSGFKQAPFIARRSDGQVVQMPELLYRLAEQVDGQSDLGQIADGFSHAIERQVEAPDVEMLIEEQLRPLGIVAPAAGAESIELNKVDPLLSLKLRTSVVPDGAVRSLTTVFRPLFLPPVIVALVLGLIGVDGWLFFVHGVTQSLRHTLYQPALMLMLIGGVILATAFHEIGHATACRYGGAKPGVMGVGIYIVWPAFYTDITDAYRLGKAGRLRTDLGGMYFNAIFAVLTAGLYAVTSFEPLLLLIVLQNFAIIQQALPLLRLDGYYILSDLTGVPDIFQRIRPVLTSFIPGRPADARITELKSWVRAVVTAYVLLVVVFLCLTVLALVINLPRIVATGFDSAALHFQAIGPAFSHGRTIPGVLDLIQTLFLILPGAGLAYTAVRVARRTTVSGYRWSAGHPGRQATLGLAGAAAVAVAAFSWLPNGEYRPLQPGERGTLTGLLHQITALPTGRPSLTVQRQQQLGGAPTERRRQSGSVPPVTGARRPATGNGNAGGNAHGNAKATLRLPTGTATGTAATATIAPTATTPTTGTGTTSTTNAAGGPATSSTASQTTTAPAGSTPTPSSTTTSTPAQSAPPTTATTTTAPASPSSAASPTATTTTSAP